MADISKSAKCSGIYTPHCLRATAITAMSEAGFEARQIMFMSGHRSESSLSSYNRTLSNEQKLSVSSCLSSITHPNSEKQLTSSNVSNTVTCKEQENAIVPLQTSAEMLSVDFKIHHPSILWDLLNSCRNRCSTTVFLTSNNSVNFTAAMSVLRENQITSPEIVHSAIFVFHYWAKLCKFLFFLFFISQKW